MYKYCYLILLREVRIYYKLHSNRIWISLDTGSLLESGQIFGKCRVWPVFFSTDIVFKGSLLFVIFTQNSDKREIMLGAVQQYRTRMCNVYPR
jgi:hypothetical protein